MAVDNFSDDFTNPSFEDRWEIIYISPSAQSPLWETYNWRVVDGKLGVFLGNSQMRTHVILKNGAFSNYTYSLELTGRRGEDKNILFRYKNKDNWYGFHINNSGTFFGTRKNGSYSDVKVSSFSFLNNVVYNIDIVLIEDKVSFFVNGNKIVDSHKINDNFILSGTVGLKVSTGATYPSEVYFDDIKITKINTPVVLIPGHGASFNFKEMFLDQPDPGGWRMTPGVNIYNNIITSLEANGYKKNEDLFIFNYNWLNPISDSANKLYAFIENITSSSPFSSVKVIGHSMGGLVARTCLQEKENDCFIDQLVTAGSPHRGVLETYGAWEGGEVWRDGLTRLVFELFLNIKKEPLETNKEAIRRFSPALEEMLPSFAYLKNTSGEQIDFDNEDYPKSFFLERIAETTKIKNKTTFIFGRNEPTLRWLILDNNLPWTDRILGNWKFGKPIEKEFSVLGDETVLDFSAYPSDDLSGKVFNLDHEEIVGHPTAVGEIMTTLGLKPEENLNFLASENSFLVFYLHSPAYLEMVDKPPDSVFLGDEDGTRLIIVAKPDPNKDYLVDVVGNNKGKYRLTVGKIDAADSFWRDYGGFIEDGETDSFRITPNELLKTTTTETLQPIEELFLDLKKSNNPDLEPKISQWQELFNSDYNQALIYGYRLRNWLSLLAEGELGEADFVASLSRVEAIINYLEELSLSGNQSFYLGEKQALLNFWSEGLLNFSSMPEPDNNSNLLKLAAFDHIESSRYYSRVIAGTEGEHQDLVYSFSGLGLLRNSQILLQP